MRVAVLADIHANVPALEAVLAEIEACRPDRIVLNGDIAAGPLPGETIDRLLDLGERALWVHGNTERIMTTGSDEGSLSGPPPEIRDQLVEAGYRLTARQRAAITNLPLTVTLEIDGLGTVLFCHATPRRDDEVVLVDSPPNRFATVLAGVAADVVVLGHTHMPFARLVGGRWVLNPGSVGMPYGHAGAAWALLGPTIELRRTAYDADAAAARLRQSAFPGASEWADAYVLRQYSDLDALAVFTPMAGDDGP